MSGEKRWAAGSDGGDRVGVFGVKRDLYFGRQTVRSCTPFAWFLHSRRTARAARELRRIVDVAHRIADVPVVEKSDDV